MAFTPDAERFAISGLNGDAKVFDTRTLEPIAILGEQDAPFIATCFLAAGLMYILVHQGDWVGLMTFDSRLQQTFPPVGSYEGLRPLLLHLEQIAPKGASDIETALHEAAETALAKLKAVHEIVTNPNSLRSPILSTNLQRYL